jgi:superfamily II DNA or RNA helicase
MGIDVSGIPARVCFVRKIHTANGSHFVIPRGALSTLQRAAERAGVDLSFRSEVVSRSAGAVSLDDMPIQLRPYQRAAAEALLGRVQGYVRLPCGAGKTVLGCAAIVASGEPSIVIVHTEDLADQWAGALRGMFGVQPRRLAGGTGSWGPLKEGEIMVAMVQSLHRAQWRANELLASAGAVLLDECHHTPATTYRDLLRKLPARHRWGLTATPERADGWGCLLPMFVGPEVYGMSTEELVDRGHLLRPEILPILSGVNLDLSAYNGRNGRLNIGGATTALGRDEGRQELIVSLATMGAKAGRTALVLVPRVKLAHTMATRLRGAGLQAAAITGKVDKRTRADRLAHLRTGQLQVLVATQLADEGLDVPTLDLLINASAGRAAGRAVQRVGRAMRPSPGKATPVVVELVDGAPFRSQWGARQRAYLAELGLQAGAPVRRDKALETFGALLKKHAT